jgi:uncharacterized protein YdeI (YjbR/CyaY-like superfamily)
VARVTPLACGVVTPVFFASAADWRDWLAQHHESHDECLVGLIKATTGDANMSWSESVDVALCFGWIDGVRRRIDDRTYSIRFTPRKPGSIWSAINVAKIARLRAAGELTEAGERAFAMRSEAKTAIYAYERDAADFSEAETKQFRANRAAWSFFSEQAAWYRRNATHWVVRAKREDTRARRFAQLLADSGEGRRLAAMDRYR